ncbi:phage FluMu gp28-like protein [Bradyrhizobium yuanmingense]
MINAASTAPVLSRNPAELPEELPRGAELPDDFDPLAEGVLMKHQREWLEDDSDLKLGEKGRRTGITFAEALDDTLLAAKSRTDGGMNVFYIGDTKDKGREFIGYVAHFARIVAGEQGAIEEFLFEDQKDDGSSSFISAFRVIFASGFRVEALSSRPENIRGLQGKVVVDEAAFHKDVRLVLDAVNALLIWGGKIVIISTHNGVLNAFNELILETKAGKIPYSLHLIPFRTAIENGLFRRVCLMRGKPYSKEAEVEWEAGIRAAYGVRTAAMAQELDCIPAESEGAALTRVQIESCMRDGIPIVRWVQPDSFKNLPEDRRKAEALRFCEEQLKPILDELDPKLRHVFGVDFARSGDGSEYLIDAIEDNLTRTCALLIELRNVPFDQQRDILFYVIDRLPRRGAGALDATGNGAYLAEAAALKYPGIYEVKLSQQWYRLNATPYVEAFGDKTVVRPKHDDVLRDHQALAYVGGIIKVPDDHRFKGTDGFPRHGDSAIAGMLSYFASRQDYWEAGYQSAATKAVAGGPDDEDEGRGWWKPPLGARIRGGF